MAESPATLTTVDGILKEFYLPTVRENITKGLVLYEKLQRNSEDVAGREAVISINYGRNPGIGSAAENAALPDSGHQQFKQAKYSMKYLYGVFGLTGQSIRATKNDAGALAKTLDREMKGLTRDFKNELNRIVNGDASGELTKVNGTTGSQTVITVDSTRFMVEGMKLTIGTDHDVILSTVDSDTQITILAAINVADNDVITREDADEANGIANLIDTTGTIGNIDRSTNAWWKAIEQSNSGTTRDMTLPLLQTLQTAVEQKTNNLPDFYLSKHALRDVYINQLVPDKRYVNTNSMDAGAGRIPEFGGVPWYSDKDAANGVVFAITQEHLNLFEQGPFDWMDLDGAILSRVRGYDKYEGTLFYYHQAGADNCRNLAKLTDLSETYVTT